MGKLRVFDIVLDNHQGVYFAGQHVNGRVIVELDAPMKMRGMGSGENNNLPQGQHAFPFSFILPPSLPSSFEGTWGYVRYTIKATIDKPWKFDHDTKRPFTVVALLDLNLQPNAMSATTNQATKMLCCLCCKSGPINGMFRIERMGYVPGEAIPFTAEIQNFSRATCDVHVQLGMTTMFHATSKSRSDHKEVARVVHDEVAPGDSSSWGGSRLAIPALPPSFLVGCNIIDIRYYLETTTFHATTKSRSDHKEVARVVHDEIAPGDSSSWGGSRLVIPALPPSFLVGCNIIDIRYYLELIIDPSGPAFKLHVPLEIIIGTIPLNAIVHQRAQQQQYGLPPPQGAPHYGLSEGATAPPAPSAPEMPPPSYSDCVLGQVSIKDKEDNDYTRGDMNYTPKYPYYNWSK
ncbi:hypothetical protein FSP39_019320 [Pinctada imbricata]|uniref:Arrestin C-terminal-like domain-containing protein n=1 Tax=Pinctada imbricata TaxID=66713 RepID=A0AA88YBW4_PINIB|nr:hypothetical protein FSP39_019320 [Pinctada imbricata]